MARQTAVDCQVLLQGRLYAADRRAVCSPRGPDLGPVRQPHRSGPAAALSKTAARRLFRRQRGRRPAAAACACASQRWMLGFIRQAQPSPTSAFPTSSQHIAAGRSEREIALEMEFFIRRQGAQGVSFDFIVVAGRKLLQAPRGAGSDWCSRAISSPWISAAPSDGYCTDMTRTVAVGQVSDEQRQVYDIVLQANRLGVTAGRPGRRLRRWTPGARRLIADAGYGECFGHGLGHGVGLDIHEEPRFFRPAARPLTRAGHGHHRGAGHLPAGQVRGAHRGHGRHHPGGWTGTSPAPPRSCWRYSGAACPTTADTSAARPKNGLFMRLSTNSRLKKRPR